MANETTTTTMGGVINSSLISKVLLSYQIDPFVAFPTIRMEQIPAGTKTLAMALPTKGSAGSISEGTAMSNTALTFNNTTITAAEYGVLRLVTKLAARTNILGEAETYQFVVQDGTRLCLEKFETDVWAQWASASTSVGTSNTTMTIANAASAISYLPINKAVGPFVMHLSTQQARDLRAALAATTGTVWASQNVDLLNVVGPDGYAGMFMGVPVFTSNLAATANASVDKVGVVMVNGAKNPSHAATGCGYLWMPEDEQVGTPSYPGRQMAVTMAYGLAEVVDGYYTKIVTTAT